MVFPYVKNEFIFRINMNKKMDCSKLSLISVLLLFSIWLNKDILMDKGTNNNLDVCSKNNSYFVYYIQNDFLLGGYANILNVPDTCQPDQGFIIYGYTQVFTCQIQPTHDVFGLESPTPEWPYVKIFNCFLSKNGSTAELMEDCGFLIQSKCKS